MVERPLVLIFDVNETLLDLTPLQPQFADVGRPYWRVVRTPAPRLFGG
ncbi:MAG: hypothetical protein LC739_06440 [Actinobacteria bacterium]|nr:hypothetical protein [Actinomycetota bacterium]